MLGYIKELLRARQPAILLAWGSLASLLVGLFIHPHGFVAFVGIATVLLLGIAWPGLNLLGCRGRLTVAVQRLHEDETVTLQVVLHNHSFFTAWGLVLEGLSAPIGFTRLPARSKEARTCCWQPARRGRFPRCCDLTTAFPFGLFCRRRPAECPQDLVVWPRILPVPDPPDFATLDPDAGRLHGKRPGLGGDFIGARPYRQGDSLRRVHWGQTARHDRLVVCEFQAPTRPRVLLVVDVNPEHRHGQGNDSSLEWSLRIAASFACSWLAHGVCVGLRLGSTTLEPANGLRQKRLLLDALALFDEPRPPALAEVLSQARARDALRIIIAPASALAALPPQPGPKTQDRFVCLYDPSQAAGGGLGIEPWIEISAPSRAPQELARRRGESRHD